MRSLQLAVLATALASSMGAATISGIAAGIASNIPTGGPGTHFHNAIGAEVGGLVSVEEVRGVAEFNLAGVLASVATLRFDVATLSGCCGQGPYTGTINVFAYQGDNATAIGDFDAATFASIGSFSAAGLIVGNQVTLDVTSALATAIGNGYSALGIRLQAATVPTGNAITFNNFAVDTSDVPEPSTYGLFAAGLAAITVGRLRHKQPKA